jgi:hypothetical protein
VARVWLEDGQNHRDQVLGAHDAHAPGPARKSEEAEYKYETVHIDLSNTAILDEVPGYMDHLIKEVIEIRFHPRKLNRDGGYNLSRF